MTTGHFADSGIQSHSVGGCFPVLDYRVGNDYAAEFQGVLLTSPEPEQHRRNIQSLQLAERLTDKLWEQSLQSGGGTVHSLTGDKPVKGFMVSGDGCEVILDGDDYSYRALFQYVHGHRGYAHHDVYYGVWASGNRYYLDVSYNLQNRKEALRFGAEQSQIAIFDVANVQVVQVVERRSRLSRLCRWFKS